MTGNNEKIQKVEKHRGCNIGIKMVDLDQPRIDPLVSQASHITLCSPIHSLTSITAEKARIFYCTERHEQYSFLWPLLQIIGSVDSHQKPPEKCNPQAQHACQKKKFLLNSTISLVEIQKIIREKQTN